MFMSLFASFLFHFGVPLLFSWLMARRSYRSKADWLVMFFLVAVYIIFAYLAGRWYYFGLYWRYLLPVAFGLGSVISLTRIKFLPWFGEQGKSNWMLLMFTYMFTALLGVMAAWSFYGRFLHVPAIEIMSPLKGQDYAIAEGGDSPLLNQYHVLARAPYKYSVDFIQLNDWQTRAERVSPEANEAYHIFGDSVFAPFEAIVTATLDTLADSSGAIIDTSSARIWGNYVLLTQENIHLILGYLQNGSVAVTAGDTIKAGTFLGLVGASGGTPEPKLHLHAFQDYPESIWKAIGLPLLINGVFPYRNLVFDFR